MKEKALCLFALFLPLEQLLLYVFGIDTELKPYRVFLILAFTLTFIDKGFFKNKLTFVFKSFLFIFIYGLVIGLLRIGVKNGELTYLTNGALHFLIGLLIFYLFSNITNNKLLFKIGNYLIIGTIISSLFGLYFFIFSPYENYRLRGFFNNPNHLSITINFISAFLFYKYENRRKINLFLIIFLSIIVFISGSRTGVFIQGFNLLFFIIVFFKNTFNFVKVISTGLIAFYLIIVPILGINDNFLNRFDVSSYQTGSGRWDIADAALNLGIDTYFTGVGIGQYRFYHSKYISSSAYETVLNYELSTHNHYLDLLINYGFISFLLYIGILIFFLKTILKQRTKQINKFVFILIFSLIVSSLSQEMLIFPIFWVGISILTNYTYRPKKSHE